MGIVTVAPELAGGLDLIRWLAARGHYVSLGHSAATYDEALAGVAAGARQSTHLFNRMPPLHHRAPGLAGAVLQADEVAAEIICDGVHVHPALVRAAIAAKRPSRVMAITDATAAAGLPVGGRASIGGYAITAAGSTALLDDGTIAGSVTTMDRVFQFLVAAVGLSLVDAATLCATTPRPRRQPTSSFWTRTSRSSRPTSEASSCTRAATPPTWGTNDRSTPETGAFRLPSGQSFRTDPRLRPSKSLWRML